MSLLEALVDFQFEVLTTHLNDGRRLPRRSSFRSAHAYLSAPYGVYPARDGFLAIAMTPIPKLAGLLGLKAEFGPYNEEPATWFSARDEIKAIIAQRIGAQSVDHWLGIHPRACRHLVRQGAELTRDDGA
jgi:crotonobetainyl-CoA:carnitine CoA-transferase CaiB-like acyl-CoA transferase